MNLFTHGVFILIFNFYGGHSAEKPNCPAPKNISGGKIYGCRRDSYEDLGTGISTTCFLRCKERLLHQGPRKIVCDMNGGWNGAASNSLLPSCVERPIGHLCEDTQFSCPTWKDVCGSTNQIVDCVTADTGESHKCYCIDDPEVDYLKDLYLNPPKCDHCKKTGLKCEEGRVWGCKEWDPLNFESCKCIPIKVHGRCERLRKIVVERKFEEEFATAEESFNGTANCTTDIKKTLSCTFSCNQGFILSGNSALTCDMNGVIIGEIPNCRTKDSCKNPPLGEGEQAQCDGSNCIIKCQNGYVRLDRFTAAYNCDTKVVKNKADVKRLNPDLYHRRVDPYVIFKCRKTPTCNGSLPNLNFEGAKFSKGHGVFQNFNCKTGFIKPDKVKNRIHCKGTWNYDVRCVKKKRCPQPPEIEGGTIYGCRANSYEEQKIGIISTCFVRCQEHLNHQYSRKIVCDHLEGTWKGEIGPYPECIENKTDSCSDEVRASYCKQINVDICEGNQQRLICVQRMGMGHCFCQDSPLKKYTPNDIYLSTLSCDWCEDALGLCKSNKLYSCSSVYEYEDCKCVKKQVHQYCIDEKSKIEKEFTNGVLNCTTLKKSKTINCSFTCNAGYYREGPRYWTCDAYGKSTQEVTSCKEMECRNFQKTPNLLYSCWKTSKGNVRCRFRCKDDPYFKLEGNEYDVCDRYIWEHGQPPTCKLICPELKDTQSFTCVHKKSAQTYICTIKCKIYEEVDGPKEITCSRDGVWSDRVPKCKLWLDDYCKEAENAYCDKIYRSRCKGANMGKCTIERYKPHRIDCGCHIPNRCWSCPFRDLNQVKGVNCRVNQQTKLWTCLVQCFPNDQDREHLTKTFTCQRNFTWSIIDKCADSWKQKPCNQAEKKNCKEFHHDGLYCTVEEKSPYRIDCGRKHPARHWECPKANFLEGVNRKCQKNAFHSKYGYNTLECNFPCTPGDKKRVNGSRSYTCYKDKWFGPEDRCFKCSGEKEGNVGNCNVGNPCNNTGINRSICLLLYENRVSGQVQTCQCACTNLDRSSTCSNMECLSGATPVCSVFSAARYTFCQCKKKKYFERNRFSSIG